MTTAIRAALKIAESQDGVVSRIQLYDVGVTRAQVRAQVCARRWRRVGSQCLAVTTGPLSAPVSTGPRSSRPARVGSSTAQLLSKRLA